MADSSQKYLDLSFIASDVRTQLVHSRGILSQVEALQHVLPIIEDPEVRAQVEASIKSLLSIASVLSTNALSTSSSAGTVIGPMFEPVK
jgi:hypothetical protein